MEMDRENNQIIVPQLFVQKLKQAFESYSYVFITAHTGWGKTSVTRELLKDVPHTFVSLWEQDALARAAADTTGMIVLDDFQAIYDYKDGDDTVLPLLRSLPADTRCLLLSRADIPEKLLPFIHTGQMTKMPFRNLALNTQEIQQLLEAAEAPIPSPEGLDYLLELTKGNPALVLVSGHCMEGNSLPGTAMEKSRTLFYSFLDHHLFQYWDPMERRLLMLTSFFDSFTIDMARIVTGNPDAESIIERLRQTGSFLERDGDTCRYKFHLMNRYLQYKAMQIYREEADLRSVYNILSLCSQLCGDTPTAVSFSLQAHTQTHTTELLTTLIRNRPKEGIQVMAGCYRQVSEYDRENVPELLCGMSMIRSWEGLTEESERYLKRLAQYGTGIYSNGRIARTAQYLATYLALHLPHWSNGQRADALTSIAERLEHEALPFPEFSITDDQPSVLRGVWDLSDWQAEESVPLKRLLIQQYGKTSSDVLILLRAERAYEKGTYKWDRVMDVGSVQVNAQYGKCMPLEFAAVVLAARVVCTQQEYPLADRITSAIQKRIQENGPVALLPYADAVMCRISLLGDHAYADTWYDKHPPASMKASVQNRYCCLTWARCCIQHQAYMEAHDRLAQLLGPLRAQNRVLDVIEALLLSAICLWRMEIESESWRQRLIEALEIAQPYEYTMLFAEMGAALLPLLSEITWPEHQGFLTRLRQETKRQAQRYPGYLSPFNAGPAYAPSLSPDLLAEQEKMIFHSICLGYNSEHIRKSLGLSVRQFGRLTNSLYAKLHTKSRKRIREMGVIFLNDNDNS